jgi:presenilin-like A22 family membrane protease
MSRRGRLGLGVGIVVGIFLAIQLSALALVGPFEAAGYQPVEDPSDPTNSILYVGVILVATVLMLAAFKYDGDQLVRLFVVFAGAWLSLYVFEILVPASVALGGLVPLALAVILGIALYVHPEWYVIDTAGVFMGGAAAGLFGIGFGILPALILLAILAVYDAISVYGTEHMLTLASGVMDLKVPVVLVIPLTLSYSFIEAETPDPTEGEDAEGSETKPPEADDTASGNEDAAPEGDADPLARDAIFIGLGDAVIPTVLVASAAFFAPAGLPQLLGVAIPAVTAMVGTFLGLGVLLWMVLQGRAHAGLPLLNGGTIAGYLIGALASGLSLVEALGIPAAF